MLLFEQHLFSSSVFLQDEQAVPRWRDAVLNVWDADWHQDTPASSAAYAFSQPAYRQRHRRAISAMFDRLQSLAHYWADVSKHLGEPILVSLSEEHPLPDCSIRHWGNQQGMATVRAERFVADFAESLIKDIIYWLSVEKRADVLTFDAEEIWVAVELLGFLCEVYDLSPQVDEQTVHAWRDATLEIGKHIRIGSQSVWDETYTLSRNIINAFNRLEKLAHNHPSNLC
jgi:hypothetical protein